MSDNQDAGQIIPQTQLDLDEGQWIRKLYLLAISLFVAVVPIIAAAGVWVWMSISESKRGIDDYLVVRAVQVTRDIDAWLREEFDVLQAIGATLSVERDHIETFQSLLAAMSGEVGRWKVMSVYDARNGEMLRDTLGSKATMPMPQVLDTIRRVTTTRQPALCSCFIGLSPENPEYGVHLFVPLSENGNVRYVLSVVLRYETMQRMIETAAASFYDIGIIDENDYFIARSDNRAAFQKFERREDFERTYLSPDRMIGTFLDKTQKRNLLNGAFSKSSLTGWTVFTGIGANNISALALQTKWALFAITGLCLLLIALVSIMILYSVMLRRVGHERIAASAAVNQLQTTLLATTSDALKEQSKAASEREVLLKEIYHRVKNNLQIIQSLLRLGARNLSPAQRDPFEAAIRRIGAMARVHTLLYNSPDLASIDLRDYLASIVGEMTEGLGGEARNIRTVLDTQSMKVPLDAAIPIAFISIELLANAFKYAFPDGQEGEIKVVTRNQGDTGVMIISDNGIGMPEMSGKPKSLGLNLVTKLVQQIGGTLETPSQGKSDYRITFPLLQEEQTAEAPPEHSDHSG